ncbi:MAG: hypothetical protein JXB25_04240 [Deltaproteobacteria bacterium]|nr:hypothetical protein [Deltaproteobacteria bacterium]
MRYRLLRYGIALLLVIVMTALAEFSGEPEIIFPEILALAVGSWVADKRPWKTTPFNLWLAPTLAALFGVLLMRYTPVPKGVMIVSAFAFVALLLTLTRSTLMPSISAAILPILIGTRSWIYPISVCFLTAIVALIAWILDRSGKKAPLPVHQGTPGMDIHPGWIFWFWCRLLIAVGALAFAALALGIPFLIAPPLIVTFVEFSHRGSPLRKYPKKIFLLLSLAAWIGSACHSTLALGWGWPFWLGAAVTSTALFFCYESLGMLFPPAAAIALLPTLLPPALLPYYPWQVMAGTLMFLMTSLLLFRPEPIKKDIATGSS